MNPLNTTGSSNYKQNQQIYENLQNGDSNSQKRTLQTRRKQDNDILKEFHEKLKNNEMLRKTNSNINNSYKGNVYGNPRNFTNNNNNTSNTKNHSNNEKKQLNAQKNDVRHSKPVILVPSVNTSNPDNAHSFVMKSKKETANNLHATHSKPEKPEIEEPRYLTRPRPRNEVNRNKNFDHLIFTNMSSNVKKSTVAKSPSQELFSNYSTNTDEHKQAQKKHFTSENNFKRIPSTKSSPVSTSSYSTTTKPLHGLISNIHNAPLVSSTQLVVLPKNWSGRHVSLSASAVPTHDFKMDVVPPQTSRYGKNLTGIVFRNVIPIKDVQPASDKDVFKTLERLDQAIGNETESKSFYGQPETQVIVPRGIFYSDSKCKLSDMEWLRETIINTSLDEGLKLKNTFYKDLNQILNVVNVVIKNIPKHIFPFTINPVTTESEMEKTGEHSLDIYLTLNEFNRDNIKVIFVKIKNDLKALASLDNLQDEQIKKFGVFNEKANSWCLSASALMMTFIYVINNKLKNEFANGSPYRHPDILENTEIYFSDVSERNVKLHIKLPEYKKRYLITLKLVIDVVNFPLVLNETRAWPPMEVKNLLIRNGVHLVAEIDTFSSERWSVSFYKSRNLLIERLAKGESVTKILLTLQALSNKYFLIDQQSPLLPVHFIMILFWTYSRYESEKEWKLENGLGECFIDIVVALKVSLQKQECADFFFPRHNHFENLEKLQLNKLLCQVEDFLRNPIIILKSVETNK